MAILVSQKVEILFCWQNGHWSIVFAAFRAVNESLICFGHPFRQSLLSSGVYHIKYFIFAFPPGNVSILVSMVHSKEDYSRKIQREQTSMKLIKPETPRKYHKGKKTSPTSIYSKEGKEKSVNHSKSNTGPKTLFCS